MKKLSKRMKNLDAWDMSLTKITMVALTLFVITVWPAAMDWVHTVHWRWFLGMGVLFAIRPCYKFWFKK